MLHNLTVDGTRKPIIICNSSGNWNLKQVIKVSRYVLCLLALTMGKKGGSLATCISAFEFYIMNIDVSFLTPILNVLHN